MVDASTLSLNAPDRAVAFCVAQVGKPYEWGETGPAAYDCSGLMQAGWKAAGVAIPRTTYEQVRIGQAVSYADAAPGDLIFPFADISHVVMFIGNGQVVQAPQTGELVNVVPYYGAAGGIRRVTDMAGTGASISSASLVTGSNTASQGQSGALTQLHNLYSTLTNGREWASFAYIVGGFALLLYGISRSVGKGH